MTLYSIALFLHVAGALGVFAALALDWVGVANLRRARTAEQAREWAGLYRIIRVLGAASVVALLVFGLYMTAVTWGPTGWIVVGFFSLLFIAVLGAVSGIRLGRILAMAVRGEGALTEDLCTALRAPLFVASVRTRSAVAFGVVFLMTVKPDAAGSLLVIAIAVVLGIASAIPLVRRRPLRAQSV
jgi:hypothetical protein